MRFLVVFALLLGGCASTAPVSRNPVTVPAAGDREFALPDTRGNSFPTSAVPDEEARGAAVMTTWILNSRSPDRYSVAQIGGASMRPTSPDRAYGILEQVTVSALRVGDWIVFRDSDAPSGLIGHRVYRVEHGRALTWGDNNQFPDPHIVTDENLLGRIVAVFYVR